MIDALYYAVKKVNSINNNTIEKLKNMINFKKDIVLVTDIEEKITEKGFINICKALKKVAEQNSVQIIYPVHMNPNVQKPVNEILKNVNNILLIDPLPYEAFLWLMEKSKLIITDSGGIQEEAPSLGKPVLVMRETTERPEAVDAGTVILVGTNTQRIIQEANNLLQNDSEYERMSKLHNPYGDGKSSKRILNFLLKK